MDYVSMSDLSFEFEECDTRYCVNVTVNNDMTLEETESFYVYDIRIFAPFFFPWTSDGEIVIMDDDERKHLYSYMKYC